VLCNDWESILKVFVSITFESITMASSILSISLAALALSSSVLSAATGGDFNILSFNVAGLPALFNGNDVPGDKATNARSIGRYFAQYDYDVINMQEGMKKFLFITTLILDHDN
jgi:hypothetical protein